MKPVVLLMMIFVGGCAASPERIVNQLIDDNKAGTDGFAFGWYHEVKAVEEFDTEARACAGGWSSGVGNLSGSTMAASITQCLILKGWKLDGFLPEIVVL
jgi:hypothetical protein